MLSFNFSLVLVVVTLVLSACSSISQISDVFEGETLPPIRKIPLPEAENQPSAKGQSYYDPNRAGALLYDTHGKETKSLGRYFTIRDFSHTGDIAFRYARIDPVLATCLNQLRSHLKRPITVNSGYRSWSYNEQLIAEGHKASRKSYHLSGKAADVYIPGIGVAELAKLTYKTCGCGTGFGVAKSWFHIDSRGRSVRPWGYGGTPKLRLNAARRVHKSQCGKGERDLNEIGQNMLHAIGGAFDKIKSKWNDVIK